MPFEKGAGTGGDFVRSIGGRPRWRSRRLPPSGFIDAGGRAADSVVGALDGIRLRRRFSRRRSSGGRAGASFPFGALPPAVWHAEAPSDGFAILLQAHGRLRSSRFIVRRRTCRRKPFFEADGRRRTYLGAGVKPDRSGGGVRYAVVQSPFACCLSHMRRRAEEPGDGIFFSGRYGAVGLSLASPDPDGCGPE